MSATIWSRPPAAEVLTQNAQPLLRRLKVEETDQEIVISGTVPSYYLKQLAQEAVRPILDGRRIRNRIRVSEPL
ncbi:MAG TPA: BON domain-containing protein [Gemmataceae bacterium]|jgi:hypothetical protein|nr:BON domain-containing protein [Gemmataceae bacterium]